MDFNATIITLAIALTTYGISLWQSRRPVILGKIRYIPWSMISFLALLAVLFMTVHFLTLLKVYMGGN